MVHFGGHVEAFRVADNRNTALYLVNYNQIKGIIFKENFTRDQISEEFLDKWNAGLLEAETNYREARREVWEHVFQTVAEKDPENVRGSHPGNALKSYIENVLPEKSQDLLTRMGQIHRAASVNIEALRKLVKKFDKHFKDAQLSLKMLPTLYTSSLYTSQHMLSDGIGLVRELIEEGKEGSQSFKSMIRSDSEAQHQIAVNMKMEELNWLKRLASSITDEELGRLVAHRGFHHIHDRNDKRPIENSLSAYELAWTSGIQLCECDIAMTRDEKLVLAHDETFMRLALDVKDQKSFQRVSELTFREIIALPLKSHVRPPLLIDVLRSASAISDKARLIIEIKPGNQAAASALVDLLIRHEDLRMRVAMIMSFDAITMHRLRAELYASLDNYASSCSLSPTHHRLTSFDHFGTLLGSSHQRTSSYEANLNGSVGLSLSQMNLDANGFHSEHVLNEKDTTLPKLMLLTVSDPPKAAYELRVGVSDLSPVDGWLTNQDGSLDGVYLQFQKEMMTPEGRDRLKELSSRCMVGIWSYSGVDPDNYETFHWLVHECGCSFVNTDLPNHFRDAISVSETNTL